jgi:hypothetical protein
LIDLERALAHGDLHAPSACPRVSRTRPRTSTFGTSPSSLFHLRRRDLERRAWWRRLRQRERRRRNEHVRATLVDGTRRNAKHSLLRSGWRSETRNHHKSAATPSPITTISICAFIDNTGAESTPTCFELLEFVPRGEGIMTAFAIFRERTKRDNTRGNRLANGNAARSHKFSAIPVHTLSSSRSSKQRALCIPRNSPSQTSIRLAFTRSRTMKLRRLSALAALIATLAIPLQRAHANNPLNTWSDCSPSTCPKIRRDTGLLDAQRNHHRHDVDGGGSITVPPVPSCNHIRLRSCPTTSTTSATSSRRQGQVTIISGSFTGHVLRSARAADHRPASGSDATLSMSMFYTDPSDPTLDLSDTNGPIYTVPLSGFDPLAYGLAFAGTRP